MEKLVVEGGHRLSGTVQISGAKNSALPILAATLLTDEKCVIKNVPRLSDISLMREILDTLGTTSRRDATGAIRTQPVSTDNVFAPYDLVSRMRASICVLGPLLAKRGRARISMPGGCVIGVRPVELHIKGMEALGATVELHHGDIVASGKLRGTHIYLGGAFGSSVTGTANILMAAVLAEGKTVIDSAACEPEVDDLCRMLIKMGAKIEGAGTPKLVIHGVEKLSGCEHEIIPDRIEATTFVFASAMTPASDVILEGVNPEHLGAVLDVLNKMGIKITQPKTNAMRVRAPKNLKPADIVTLPFPGFPTDSQALAMSALSVADGLSIITERIYPDRFMHIPEMNRLGARIRKEGGGAIIGGVENLYGAPVQASDLRAAAGLVIAGLAAKSVTEVNNAHYIDRGYENIEEKLRGLGAKISREKMIPRRRKSDAAA
ncbi:MAG: UDP-N-acetylglucosamine 1-carboxyvinyltransferase [Planctomycetes bacterium]|nr:UDP-N-acetylglucosamine 1-carboxyvinyltransferase [Planctomycetota bacterium]